MFCCLFHCFKVGLKQRKVTILCIAISVLVLLLIQSQTPDGPLKAKSLDTMKNNVGRRGGGRRLSEDTDEEDSRRNAKQETIRMLKQFAKGFFFTETYILFFCIKVKLLFVSKSMSR